jgi:ABC-type transporter Mla MlaB component
MEIGSEVEALDEFVAGELRIEVAAGDGAALRLVWRGRSATRTQNGRLEPYLTGVVDLTAERGQTLEIDFRPLERCDSSTLVMIVRLIQRARALGVRLVLMHDPKRYFQRLNFDALRMFSVDSDMFEVRSA